MNLRAADQHNRSIYEHAYVSAYAPTPTPPHKGEGEKYRSIFTYSNLF